jgi:hypothetical protein
MVLITMRQKFAGKHVFSVDWGVTEDEARGASDKSIWVSLQPFRDKVFSIVSTCLILISKVLYYFMRFPQEMATFFSTENLYVLLCDGEGEYLL